MQTRENILREKKKEHKIKKKLAHILKTHCVMGETSTNYALNHVLPIISCRHFSTFTIDKITKKRNEVEHKINVFFISRHRDRWQGMEMVVEVQMVLSVPVFQNVDYKDWTRSSTPGLIIVRSCGLFI